MTYRFSAFRQILLLPLTVVLTLAIPPSTSAQTIQEKTTGDQSEYADFKGLETADFRILDEQECRNGASLQALKLAKSQDRGQLESFSFNPLSWTPTGAAPAIPAPQCEPEVLENILMSHANSVHDQAKGIFSFFKECNLNLSQDSTTGVMALLRSGTTEYDFCGHPNIRKVAIRLPNNDIIRGFLALKPGTDKRPLVIAKCGVFCDAMSDSTLRFMVMHLFDESPFNVLAINNDTGADYVADNNYISVGGFYEGQQLVRLLQLLKTIPLNQRVTTVHLVGASLGSQAALFASYLAPFSSGKEPLLHSVLAACPVVNLQETMQSLFSRSARGFVIRQLYNNAKWEAIRLNPETAELFPPDIISTEDIPDAVVKSSVSRLQTLGKGWELPPFQDVQITNEAEFWKYNNFLNFAKESDSVPTLAFAGNDDSVVPATGNAGELANVARASDRAPRPSSPISSVAALTVPGGDHCAFDIVYGWRTISTLFRSYILSHSPEMNGRIKNYRVTIATEKFSGAGSLYTDQRETHVTQEFKLAAGSPDLQITFKIASPWANGCQQLNPRDPDATCVRYASASIPLQLIRQTALRHGIPAHWSHIPINDAEAESLTRWANVHLSIVDQKGRALELTQGQPAGLKWNGFEIN